ncbi:MAG TPA: ABC transporter permease [Terriglobales bacterium]|nr:ABC transporter permease [Terriglobales bacterium]
MHNLLQDIRFAARQLRKSPAFTFTALLTLAVGIGANVVVFGVLNSMLLSPLPVPHPEQVYSLDGNSSYSNYVELRDRNSMLAGIAATRPARLGLEVDNTAQPVWANEISGNYFQTMQVEPAIGRLLQPSDEHGKSAAPVAVLSYECWRARFHADPAIVGQTVRVNKQPYTVIGVLPRGFHGTEKFFWPEVWLPVLNEAQIEGYNWIDEPSDYNAWLIARVKPGISEAQAEANLNSIAAQISREHPDRDKGLSFKLAQPGFLGDMLSGPVHAFLWGIMLLAGLVLLAACVNLGGLLAARTADRSRELAIRMAIGSSRARLFRQVLVESVLISILGGGLALLLGDFLLQLLNGWQPVGGTPIEFVIAPSTNVYVFGLLVSVLTGVLFASVVARQIWRSDPNLAMKNAGGTSGVAPRWALRDILLAVQVALCCLLVTACFVSMRGLQRAVSTPLGFHPQGITLAATDLYLAGYSQADIPQIQQKLLDDIAHLPGVQAAAYANSTPMSIDYSTTSVSRKSQPLGEAERAKIHAGYYQVSPGYFAVAQTQFLAGRDFTWHDDKSAPRVAIVNRTLAHKLFGDENPIGQTMMSHGKEQIVGVVQDGKYQTLTEEPQAAIFYPILQESNTSTVLLAGSTLPSAQIVAEVHDALHRFDSSIPIFSLGGWSDELGLALLPAQVATVSLGAFGLLAMLLAITGIFGLASYTVSKRLRELGIRVALGAQSLQVLRAALTRTLMLLGVGSILGLLLGIAASKVLASIVYQASGNDPVVIAAVVITMALVGIVAASIPARRALSIHPMDLLREE